MTRKEKRPWGYEIDKGRQGPACVIRKVDRGAFEGGTKRGRDEMIRDKGEMSNTKSGRNFYRRVKAEVM